MKWENKGKEYEYLRDTFESAKDIYVYGENVGGISCYQTMKRLGLSVKMIRTRERVTNNISFGVKKVFKLAGRGNFNEIKNNVIRRLKKNVKPNDIVYAPSSVLSDENCLVVISLYDSDNVIQKMANRYGLEPGKTIFDIKKWMRCILPVFIAYTKDMTYVNEICIVTTTRCTLNCEKCLDFVPYNHHKQDYSLDYLKRCVDSFFNYVDYVKYFRVTGGEPLKNKELVDFLRYLYKAFGSRIEEILLITNATIIPGAELIKVIKSGNIKVKIDDYSRSVPVLKKRIKEWERIIHKEKIDGTITKAVDWLDLFPASVDMKEFSDKQMINRYDTCGADVFCLVDEKICNCNFSDFAYTAGVYKNCENEYYDLRMHSDDKRMELIEFMNGWSDKGYNDFCRYCNGFAPINKNKLLPAAVQAKGQIECDQVG